MMLIASINIHLTTLCLVDYSPHCFVGMWVGEWWGGGEGLGRVIFTTCSHVTFPVRLQLSYASFPSYCRIEVIICVKNDVFAAALPALIFDKSICCEYSNVNKDSSQSGDFIDFCLRGGLLLWSWTQTCWQNRIYSKSGWCCVAEVHVLRHMSLRPTAGDI